MTESRDSKGRWRKGMSGNPQGRPRGTTISEHLRAMLAESVTIDDEGEPITTAQRIARIVIERALADDQWCIQFVVDRVEGRPAIVTDELEPLPVIIIGEAPNNGD